MTAPTAAAGIVIIGDYVYGKRHNRDLDQKRTVAQKLLDHVSLGVQMQ